MKKLFARLFGKKEEKPVTTNAEFWDWFAKHHKAFHKIVSKGENVEEAFFTQLGPKLDGLRPGYWFLCGMYNEKTADLVITADSFVKNIVFAEELIAAAPALPGWRFTALKPAHDIADCNVSMGGYTFSSDTLKFYAVEDPYFPDEINIVLVHRDYTPKNADDIIRGSYIFLEHYLGELNSVTSIDSLDFAAPTEAACELIDMERLKSYLVWREKEFVEKYEDDTYHHNYEDGISVLEAELEDGSAAIATMNTRLLSWEGKVTYPWMLRVTIAFDPNGEMPDFLANSRLNDLEDRLIAKLSPNDGYLWLGHETSRGERDIYFACKEFRKVSKVLWEEEHAFQYGYNFAYDIFKDKYWRSLQHFMQ
ncbi:DUF695 domain-containing protein [Flavobacterium sp. RHBU_3]|uniref:DUF695 domain-containing protein n=1 Tax=Flavobacterium sp. RHBU_3 TaxID=3391184 RepID=UPI0039849E0C